MLELHSVILQLCIVEAAAQCPNCKFSCNEDNLSLCLLSISFYFDSWSLGFFHHLLMYAALAVCAEQNIINQCF